MIPLFDDARSSFFIGWSSRRELSPITIFESLDRIVEVRGFDLSTTRVPL